MSALLATEPDTRRTLAYVRISEDALEGQLGAGQGVTRQRHDCVREAGYLGLDVVPADVFVDNDQSAAEGKQRDDWDRMMEDVETGEVGTVIAWSLDRVTRNDNDFHRMRRAALRHGVTFHMVRGGPIDFRSANGMLAARNALAQAIYEVEKVRERMIGKHEQLARDGKPNGGIRRFGFNSDMTHRATEAALIKDYAERLLAGESLAGLVTELNANGVPTVTASVAAEREALGMPPMKRKPSKHWDATTLRQMLTGRHMIGQRVHTDATTKETVVTKADAWEPILDEATWTALCKMLADPSRVSNRTGSNAAKHLLSGIARCVECGSSVRTTASGAARNGQPRRKRYKCTDPTCKVSRFVPPIDRMVEAATVARLRRMDGTGLITHGKDSSTLVALRRDVAEAEQELDELADAIEAKRTTLGLAQRLAQRLEHRLEELRPQLAAAEADAADARRRPVRVLAGATGSEADAIWPTLPLERQRAIVDLLMDVRITRPTGRGPVTSDAVVIEPKALA